MVVDVRTVAVHLCACASLGIVVTLVHLVHQSMVEHCWIGIILHGIVLHCLETVVDGNVGRSDLSRGPLARYRSPVTRIAVASQRNAMMRRWHAGTAASAPAVARLAARLVLPLGRRRLGVGLLGGCMRNQVQPLCQLLQAD